MAGKPTYEELEFRIQELEAAESARKHAEEEFRMDKEHLQAILDNTTAVIYQKDKEGRFTLINREFERTFNISQEDIIGKTDYDLMPTEMADKYRENDKKVLKSKKPLRFEETALLDDGVHTAISTKAPMYNGHDSLIGICGISTDITDRIKMEEALRESNKKLYEISSYLEAIVENANVWLNVLDREGNIVIWNKAAEQVSGYLRGEVIGRNEIWEWFYPDAEYREEIFAKAKAIIEQGEEIEDFETTIRTKSDNSKVISWHSRSLTDEKGEPIGSIAIGRDVTAIKLLESQLAQARKMETIGTMAGGIAHDFNNILYL